MALYDVGATVPKLVTSARTAENLYVKAHARENPGAEGARIERLLNKGIDALLGGQRIHWTKAGVMWGHSSARPHADVEAVWESILKIVGGGKEAPIMLGCLFRHLMARRPETHWLCLTTVTDKVDPVTLEYIKSTEYWLKSNFVPPGTGSTVADLAAKWQGARHG